MLLAAKRDESVGTSKLLEEIALDWRKNQDSKQVSASLGKCTTCTTTDSVVRRNNTEPGNFGLIGGGGSFKKYLGF